MQPGNIIKGPYVLDFLGLKHEFSLYEKELEQLLISKCFLLIDLKTNELNHQDIGQMDFYVRYFDDKVRQKDDNPTIGLILCTKKDKTIVKYSLLIA
jgi:YhcG PDDEXK nuclease domain